MLASFRREIANAELVDIALQDLDLGFVFNVGVRAGKANRRVRVILRRECPFGMAYGQPTVTEVLESLRTCELMNEVKTNEQLIGAAGHRPHDMSIKDFFVQRFAHLDSFLETSHGKACLSRSH